ncbi:adipokinetic hormone/corazonin-related peptide receptor variant I-like [Cydia fagiglandana]|uniref:adipokinetic hormone/corazonin-related peptide receptor variant I-like n=1 Tax=Cydia fagiglandana TaxID=1458189 RepID=UPI002FEDFBA7
MCRLMMFTRTFGLYLSSFVLICIAVDSDDAWAGPVQWLAGDLMCRLMMFTRTFGLYLSSFVLICIAVDRYYAILKPLNVTWEANARRALHTAWVCAALASLPQSFIFHVEEHPDVAGYFQCVSYGSLPTESHVFGYFLLNMLLMYLLPLVSTLYCSLAALLEIIRRANTSNGELNMLLMYLLPLVSTLYCSLAALLEIIRRANTSNGELNMLLMYLLPLVSTLYCSLAALLEIIRRANTSNGELNMLLMYLLPLVSTLYCSLAALVEIIRRANTSMVS